MTSKYLRLGRLAHSVCAIQVAGIRPLLLCSNQVNLESNRGFRRWKEKTLRQLERRKKRFDVEPEPLRARSAWQDWNYDSELFAFANRLGEGDLRLADLKLAFTDRSFVNAQLARHQELHIDGAHLHLQDNSQLIHSGLELMRQFIPSYLRYFLRHAPEECIEAVTSHLLSDPIQADIAKWIGCIDLVNCAELPPSERTLATTIAAIVATIQQSVGMKRATSFVIDFVLTYLNGVDILEIWPLHQLQLDFESLLSSRGVAQCEPRLLYRSAEGSIECCFVVGIYSQDRLLGQSAGESASIAKQMAELDVLRNLFQLTPAQVRFEFGSKAYDLDYGQFLKPNPSIH